jgi:hypothetical protein
MQQNINHSTADHSSCLPLSTINANALLKLVEDKSEKGQSGDGVTSDANEMQVEVSAVVISSFHDLTCLKVDLRGLLLPFVPHFH